MFQRSLINIQLQFLHLGGRLGLTAASLVVIGIFGVGAIAAQVTISPMCVALEKKLLADKISIKILRSDIDLTDCRLSFSESDRNRFSVTVESFRTKKIARAEYEDSLSLFLIGRQTVFKQLSLAKSKKWDRIDSFTSNMDDNFTLFRCNSLVVTLIASDPQTMIEVQSIIDDGISCNSRFMK